MQLVEASGFSRDSTIYEIENLTGPPGLIRRFGLQVRCIRDGKMGASFTHALMALNPVHVRNASHMLSYTWGYSVGDIVDSPQEFCKKEGLEPKDTYIWMCFLCVNRHRVADRSLGVPTREFLEEFADRLEKIGHVICMLSPWHRPLYLERAWCIFEFFTATLKLQEKLSFSYLLSLENTSHKVSVVVPPRERKSLARALIYENAKPVFRDALDNVNVQQAKAHEERDRQAILTLIQSQDRGYTKANGHVRMQLRGWVAETVWHMKKNIDTVTTLTDHRRFAKYVISLWVACSYVGILVTLILLVKDQSGTSLVVSTSPPSPSSSPNGFSMESRVKSLLPSRTLQLVENDGSSPQYRAFQFVMDDPNSISYEDWRIQQRFALATFYYATDGDNWGIKMLLQEETHECTWFSSPPVVHITDIETGARLGTDSFLEYNDNPCEEKNLTDILHGRFHHLSHWQNNGMRGTLPPEVFALLPELKSLSLDSLHLFGTIPSEIGLCTNLEALSLGYNSFSSTIAPTIGQLTSLGFLSIYSNNLSGKIPSEIGQILTLRYLDLRNNSISGAIPSDLSLLARAQIVQLPINALSGTIPNAIAKMNNVWLEVLNITSNPLLTGTVPDRLCNLPFVFDCAPGQLCGCECNCSSRR